MIPEKPEALLWMDVETTGLDANMCSILEIGLRCTSLDAMHEYGRFEAVVHIGRETLLTVQPSALELHLNNGLLAQCESCDPLANSPRVIAEQALRFIQGMATTYVLHPAGTNISRFDLPMVERFCMTGLRRTAALPHAGRHRTAPRSQSLRPRPIPAPHETHAPRPRLPRQGHRGIPPLPHPHDGAGARRKGGPAMKPRCILCRKPVPDNHTRCVKHWLNNQDQWMEDDQPAHEHCTPRRRPA